MCMFGKGSVDLFGLYQNACVFPFALGVPSAQTKKSHQSLSERKRLRRHCVKYCEY